MNVRVENIELSFYRCYNFVIKYYTRLDTFMEITKSLYNYTHVQVIFTCENINFQKIINGIAISVRI